ncbi:MAG: hypothetical protein ACK5LC_09770 [Coprobacillaceae bacterium]
MPKAVIKSPLPFPIWEAITKVEIFQTKDSEDSGPVATLIYDNLAIYDEKSSQKFDDKSHLIRISGKLIVQGEVIIDNQQQFEGYAMINGQKTGIHTCSKNRLLGVVYSTEFELK